MLRVALECHAEGASKGLKDALYLVVLVVARGRDVEIHARHV